MSELQTIQGPTSFNIRRDNFSKPSLSQLDRGHSTVAGLVPFVPPFSPHHNKSTPIVRLDNWNSNSFLEDWSQFPTNFWTTDFWPATCSKAPGVNKDCTPLDSGSNTQSHEMKFEEDINYIPTHPSSSKIFGYPSGNFIYEALGVVPSTGPAFANFYYPKTFCPMVLGTFPTPNNAGNAGNFNKEFQAGNHQQHSCVEEVTSEDGQSETQTHAENILKSDEKDAIYEPQVEEDEYVDDVPIKQTANKVHRYVHGKGLVDDNGVHKAYSRWLEDCFNATASRSMVLSDIYDWFRKKFSAARTDDKGWQNSIRHNLSMNKAFDRRARPSTMPGKGSIWYLTNQALVDGIKSTTRYRKASSLKKANKKSRSSKAGLSSPTKGTQKPRKGGAKRGRLSIDNSNILASNHNQGTYNIREIDYNTNQFATPSPMTSAYSSNDSFSPELIGSSTPYPMPSPAMVTEAQDVVSMPVVPSQRDNFQINNIWAVQPSQWSYRD